MSNVVNLNNRLKAKAKAEAKKRAEPNVRLRGRTKGERELEAKRRELLAKRVDGARLTPVEVAVHRDPGTRPLPVCCETCQRSHASGSSGGPST